MASLLPARVAPTILTTAAHIPRSLSSPFLAAVITGWVVLVAPSGAGRGKKLV